MSFCVEIRMHVLDQCSISDGVVVNEVQLTCDTESMRAANMRLVLISARSRTDRL
jgi:hypothetical protein